MRDSAPTVKYLIGVPLRLRPRGLALALAVLLLPVRSQAEAHQTPGRSTDIALTRSNSHLVNINHEDHSVTIFSVTGASLEKLAEVPVGREPFCVAVHPHGRE